MISRQIPGLSNADRFGQTKDGTTHSTSRIALSLLASGFLISWPCNSFAYRPFDLTDAAVAVSGELETELGIAAFRGSDTERVITAPAYVLNFSFNQNWELVLEGRGEHPQPPTEDTGSRLVGNGLFLKGVLHKGALQNKIGPSVATEFGVLLPGINDEPGMGATWIGIVSQRGPWGTAHFNAGATLTRERHTDLFVGTIIEGPYDWKIRPAAELLYEREFNTKEKVSVLAGVLWRVRDTLSFDVGLRRAWVNSRPETEVRAGMTFAFPLQQEFIRRSGALR